MLKNDLYDKIVSHFSTARNAARYFKVSENTLSNWKKSIPKCRIKEIEKALKKDVSFEKESRLELPLDIIEKWHEHINKLNKKKYI